MLIDRLRENYKNNYLIKKKELVELSSSLYDELVTKLEENSKKCKTHSTLSIKDRLPEDPFERKVVIESLRYRAKDDELMFDILPVGILMLSFSLK
ncbi:hypothetical protein [Proteus phage 3H10_20]|uniref:Uncharacterized protein n=2 Tax=Privateervirus TaxID=2843440 RepID=A0A7L7SGD4_9CAUD|nr:hypothetical protein HWD17_gp051 [Proteus phage Privateer]YP_010672313.1 hypothetical protein PQC37_gp050 [Proteus phage 3H10_20]QIN94844.1 hypothetical protein CPT_Privateer_051 [Proteus phage Privateer]QOC54836.1 hypothetical protein [Proteus phage 3H10_20]